MIMRKPVVTVAVVIAAIRHFVVWLDPGNTRDGERHAPPGPSLGVPRPDDVPPPGLSLS